MKIGVFYHHVLEAARQRNVSLCEMMKKVKAMGVDYLEMDLLVADKIEETAALLKNCGLSASNICVNYDWGNDPTDMLGDIQIRMAHAFGSDKIMPIPGLYAGEKKDPAALSNMLEGMDRLAEKARREGLAICIEDYDNARSPIASSEGMRYFLDRIPRLGVAFDTGNFLYACEDVCDAYERLSDRIIHVHLKDRANSYRPGGKKLRMDGAPMYPCAVGDGDLPLAQLIREWKDRKYQGIFTLEFYDAADYYQCIEDSVKYVLQFQD